MHLMAGARLIDHLEHAFFILQSHCMEDLVSLCSPFGHSQLHSSTDENRERPWW